MAPNKKHPDFNPPVLISGGDPAGIAPELIVHLAPLIKQSPFPVVYFFNSGESQLKELLNACKQNEIEHTIYKESPSDPACLSSLSIVRTTSESFDVNDVQPGKPSEKSGWLALEALNASLEWIEKFGCRGLLTAPLSKEHVSRWQKDFHGHTDYLSERFHSRVLMLMHGERFSVIPMTAHIPIRSVPDSLRKVLDSGVLDDLLKRIKLINAYQNSRWAVCSLNPHAGDGGTIGKEEIDFLNDHVKKWSGMDLPVEGPFAADSLFLKERIGTYRLYLSCYHDQGLIPFKSLEGNRGINATIGLPFPRTSPDHGTAFNIAGKNTADAGSMQQAFTALIKGDFLGADNA